MTITPPTPHSPIAHADIRPGMILDLRNQQIGDFDPPGMTVRVVVTDVEQLPAVTMVSGLAINTYDHEPYQIEEGGEMIVPGSMNGTADGTWDIQPEDEVGFVTGGALKEKSAGVV